MQGDHPNWAEYWAEHRAEDRAAMVSDQRLVARLTLTYCYGILPSGGDGAFGLRGICTPIYGCIYISAFMFVHLHLCKWRAIGTAPVQNSRVVLLRPR